MIDQIALDYVINILNKTPNDNELRAALDHLESGEIVQPYSQGENNRETVNLTSFLKMIQDMKYREALSSHYHSNLQSKNELFKKLSSDLYEIVRSRLVHSGENMCFFSLSTEDVIRSENVAVKDCIYVEPLKEITIDQINPKETYQLSKYKKEQRKHIFLKIVKNDPLRDGVSIAFIKGKEGYGSRVPNTGTVTYFPLSDMGDVKFQVKPDSESALYIVEASFGKRGAVYFQMPSKVFLETQSVFLDKNLDDKHYELEFLSDGQPVGKLELSTGTITGRQNPTTENVDILLRIDPVTQSGLPILKGIYFKNKVIDVNIDSEPVFYTPYQNISISKADANLLTAIFASKSSEDYSLKDIVRLDNYTFDFSENGSYKVKCETYDDNLAKITARPIVFNVDLPTATQSTVFDSDLSILNAVSGDITIEGKEEHKHTDDYVNGTNSYNLGKLHLSNSVPLNISSLGQSYLIPDSYKLEETYDVSLSFKSSDLSGTNSDWIYLCLSFCDKEDNVRKIKLGYHIENTALSGSTYNVSTSKETHDLYDYGYFYPNARKTIPAGKFYTQYTIGESGFCLTNPVVISNETQYTEWLYRAFSTKNNGILDQLERYFLRENLFPLLDVNYRSRFISYNTTKAKDSLIGKNIVYTTSSPSDGYNVNGIWYEKIEDVTPRYYNSLSSENTKTLSGKTTRYEDHFSVDEHKYFILPSGWNKIETENSRNTIRVKLYNSADELLLDHLFNTIVTSGLKNISLSFEKNPSKITEETEGDCIFLIDHPVIIKHTNKLSSEV